MQTVYQSERLSGSTLCDIVLEIDSAALRASIVSDGEVLALFQTELEERITADQLSTFKDLNIQNATVCLWPDHVTYVPKPLYSESSKDVMAEAAFSETGKFLFKEKFVAAIDSYALFSIRTEDQLELLKFDPGALFTAGPAELAKWVLHTYKGDKTAFAFRAGNHLFAALINNDEFQLINSFHTRSEDETLYFISHLFKSYKRPYGSIVIGGMSRREEELFKTYYKDVEVIESKHSGFEFLTTIYSANH